MTPKEKAIELIDKFQELNRSKISDYSRIEFPTAKQCALISVDELLESHWNDRECGIGSKVQFYRMVKSEINKL
ncbi:hypothetical protein UFOVP384_34 [uncultured Caudovirales phage]|uniref:Uncharacterized protein n=1 Tax=uncultured Caudovirales phage TaxID=2100421 RepID=A0A6J7WZW0_9CAUD|nr:hypothetical protein UFOVP384_34 [uncultured Caudovirales phage]